MKTVFIGIVLLASILQPVQSQTDFSIPGMPAPGQPKPWSPPAFTEDVLPNGMRILYAKVNDLPMVDINFIVDAGSASDPPMQSGVAYLTSELLLAGTARTSAKKLSSELAFYGTVTNHGVSYHSAQYYFSTLKENLPQSLSLIVELLSEPGFDTLALKKIKEQTIASVLKNIDNAADMTTRTLLKTMLGEEVPYAYSPQGRYRDLYALGIDDCKEFYKQRYRPNNITMVITGDIEYASLRSLLVDRTSSWEKGPIPDRRVFESQAAEPTIIVIDDSQVRQAVFRLGFPCTSRRSGDFETLLMLNEVFGADRSSRLGRALMGERTLTPFVVSGLSFQQDLGYFVVSGSIPNNHVDTVLSVVFEAIDGMKNRHASEEEMFEARKMYTDHFDLEFATNRKTQSKIQEVVAFDLPLDYYQNYIHRFNAVSAEGIRAATNVLFHSPWVLVVTGDASTIQPALEKRFAMPVQVMLPDEVIAKDRPMSFAPGGEEEDGVR